MKKYLLIIFSFLSLTISAQSVKLSGDVKSFGNDTKVNGINGTNLAGLGAGLLKITSGIPSLAVNTDLPTMTATVGGAVPTPPNDATKYLNGQGAWTVPAGSGSGTVTSVSVTTANGVSGSVATSTTTPAITLTLGAITPSTVVASSTVQTTGLGVGISPQASVHISQNMTQAAWTTNGVQLRIGAATLTDNSSSGVVAANYASYFGVPTFAASSATTYTIPYNVFIENVLQGSGATFTNPAAALGLGGHLYFKTGGSTTIATVDANSLVIKTNLSTRTTWTSAGLQTHTHTTASSGTIPFITYTQVANTGGSAGGLLWTGAAHTSQTTATEVTDIKYDLSAVLKSVDGTIANQRAFRIQGRTYTPQTSALTLTKASTFSVSSPIAGSGTTITTNAAIECDGNLLLPTVGNKIFIKEGAGGFLGVTTLVSGTKAITVTGVTTSTRCFPGLASQGGTTTSTAGYECACTANTVTINAVTSAGTNTVNTLDTSVINYFLVEPAP